MSTTLAHESDAQRYVMHIDDELVASADYSVNGNSISFNHTYTNPSFRGRGLAGDLVKFAVDDVESTTTLRVVPMCWYVAKWFDSNPDRAELLSR